MEQLKLTQTKFWNACVNGFLEKSEINRCIQPIDELSTFYYFTENPEFNVWELSAVKKKVTKTHQLVTDILIGKKVEQAIQRKDVHQMMNTN